MTILLYYVRITSLITINYQMMNSLRSLINGLKSREEAQISAQKRTFPELGRSKLATRLLLATALGSSVAGASSMAACGGPEFKIAEEQDEDAAPSEGGPDAGGDTLNSEVSMDAADAPAEATPDAEAGDPCSAGTTGFKVTVKSLAGNKYDWALFDEKGDKVKDSLLNGIDETTDNEITGVRYNYVLVQQSKSATGSQVSAEYAVEHSVGMPSDCIDEIAKRAAHIDAVTMSESEFKSMRDLCSGCSTILNGAAKPIFHYQYKASNPTYKSTVYHITFKKP